MNMSAENKPIVIVVPIKAQSEYRDQVRQRLLDLATQTQREPGNIFYVIHEVNGKPDEFLIYEKWQDQAALDFHMSQKYLTDFLRDCKFLLSEQIRGKLCTELGRLS